MSGGGGGNDTPTWKDMGIDQGDLKQFVHSQAGKQYSGLYDPNMSYTESGGRVVGYNAKDWGSGGPNQVNLSGNVDSHGNPIDMGPMIQAYLSWQKGNQQTQANWESYANAVRANGGGEGDQTITSGPAVSQRNALLGSLANAGITSPTPGIGSFGRMPQKRAGP